MLRRALVFAIVIGWVAPVWATDDVVFQLSANGTRSTRPFTVKDRWELRWDAKGSSFQVYELKPDGEPIGFAPAAAQTKPGSGSSYRPKGGTLYLRILSDGDWTITVVQLP